MKHENMQGMRFGRLIVVEYAGSSSARHSMWSCICDCGNKTTVLRGSLIKGASRSCGCLQLELVGIRAYKHGESNTRLYKIWQGMKGRCGKISCNDYKHYGARGITVCGEWSGNYSKFRKWAVGNGYSEHLTIERINNDGNYEPSNCKWIANQEQSRNTRKTVRLTLFGETKPLREWCEVFGLKYKQEFQRIYRKRKRELL